LQACHCEEPCLPTGGEATWQSILTTPAIFANLNAGEAAKLPKNCFEQKSVKSRVEQAEA